MQYKKAQVCDFAFIRQKAEKYLIWLHPVSQSLTSSLPKALTPWDSISVGLGGDPRIYTLASIPDDRDAGHPHTSFCEDWWKGPGARLYSNAPWFSSFLLAKIIIIIIPKSYSTHYERGMALQQRFFLSSSKVPPFQIQNSSWNIFSKIVFLIGSPSREGTHLTWRHIPAPNIDWPGRLQMLVQLTKLTSFYFLKSILCKC